MIPKTTFCFVNYFISVSFSITVVSFVTFFSNILTFYFISVYEIVFSSIVYENNLAVNKVYVYNKKESILKCIGTLTT